jgi:hypothetical protein
MKYLKGVVSRDGEEAKAIQMAAINNLHLGENLRGEMSETLNLKKIMD